jgi:hypothetical protein
MRAVIFVSTACQPEKPALITQAGAWVFQAFEVWEQLGRRLPDLMVAPVGDGPTLVALDKGIAELVSCGRPRGQPARSRIAEQAWRRPGWGDHHLPQRHRDPVPGRLDQRLLPGPVGEEVAGAGDVAGLGPGEHERRELAHGVVRDLLHVDAHRAGIAHRDGHGRAGVRDGDVQAGPGEAWSAVVAAAARA